MICSRFRITKQVNQPKMARETYPTREELQAQVHNHVENRTNFVDSVVEEVRDDEVTLDTLSPMGMFTAQQKEIINKMINKVVSSAMITAMADMNQVNNAGNSGMEVDEVALRALHIDPQTWISGKAANLVQGVMKTTYEKAEECFNTNYYGTKRVTEALLPLLRLSTPSARIVNVSSLRGELWRIPNDKIRSEFTDIDNLIEEKIHEILDSFLQDLKQDKLKENGSPLMLPAYGISKTALNAYTRILARKYPNMYINCVHPGYVDTDLAWHTGPMSPEEGAEAPVRLALLPEGGPSGCYFDQMNVASF